MFDPKSESRKSFDTKNNKSKHDWHLYWVYTDPEFQEDLDIYLTNLNNLSIIDPEIQSNELYENLLKNYGLSMADLSMLTSKNVDEIRTTQTVIAIGLSEFSENIEVTFDPSMTKEDYFKAWDSIHQFATQNITDLVKSKRGRNADYSKLIYAVFRARAKGKSFSEIHNDYMHQNLENFAGKPIERFFTIKSLRDYYNLYRPDKKR